VRKASHCGSKKQYRSRAAITPQLHVRATLKMGSILGAHPVLSEFHIQRRADREVAAVASFEADN